MCPEITYIVVSHASKGKPHKRPRHHRCLGLELVRGPHDCGLGRCRCSAGEHDESYSNFLQGLYGMIYVAPDPARPRPYKLITENPLELRQIMEAEQNIRHLAIKNHMHRDTNWKLLQMRAEGTEFYCYDSLVVNGMVS